MRRSARLVRPFILVALLAPIGCFKLGRVSPPIEHFVLGGGTTDAVTADVRAHDTAALTIGLRRVDVAQYLASPAIVVRRGAHQVVTSEFHRWGEEPGTGIARAVAAYLASAIPVRAVHLAPWANRTQHDYLIQVHVTRLEGIARDDTSARTGEAHVAATWEIIGPADAALVARGATIHTEAGWRVGDYRGLVTLLDRGMRAIATDLADCLRQLATAGAGAAGGVSAFAVGTPARTSAAVAAPCT